MGNPFNPKLSHQELCDIFPMLSNINIIKSGGEGTVFNALNKDNVSVAVKIYGPNHQQGRTELEVSKLSRIDNPYISKLYSYGNITIRNTNCYYTETSFIEGNDLGNLLRSGSSFTYSDVINMILCITSAITALWNERVVHCDIKPDNIIKNGDKYYLIDLGIAKHLDASTLTKTGIIMGTLGYLAPEQFKGRKNITLKADFYALGITAYEMLTGHHPFNKNQYAMLNNLPLEFPTNIEIPTPLKKLISKMTANNPLERPMNAKEIQRILQEEL